MWLLEPIWPEEAHILLQCHTKRHNSPFVLFVLRILTSNIVTRKECLSSMNWSSRRHHSIDFRVSKCVRGCELYSFKGLISNFRDPFGFSSLC